MSKAAKRERQRLNREARRQIEAQLARRRRRNRAIRGFLILAAPVVIIGAVVIALNSGSKEKIPELTKPKMTIDPARAYTATIDTTEGEIVIALDAANAPTSVNNFVYLARKGFYDGLLFNRAAKDFVIQTGSPTNTTNGGPGYTIQAELPKASYEIGSVAWAKTATEPAGTAGSQFFIGTGSNVTSLPLQYGYIGKVISGQDVAEKIMSFAPSSGDGKPTKNVKMKTVRISESAPTSTTSVAPTTGTTAAG